MSCVIGIDGGASKTRGLLVDLKGRTLASGECAGSNYHHTGLQEAIDLLLGFCQELLHEAQRGSPCSRIGYDFTQMRAGQAHGAQNDKR